MACAICNTRREKRHCPGVQGEICAICCGEQREETVSCPFDCEYLLVAREHEARQKKDPANFPNPEFRITNQFLQKNYLLVTSLQEAILASALRVQGVDNDVKEALEGLARTYKTLDSGLYYESRPTNPLAAAVFDAIQQRVAELRKEEGERGIHKILDSQIYQVLVFLHQMTYALNNGRKLGRHFLDNLRDVVRPHGGQSQPAASSLIVS
jgi:hypothetical protein